MINNLSERIFRKTLVLMLVLCMFFSFMLNVSAQGSLSLNCENADIYVLDENYTESIGEIPSEYPASVQLEVNTSDTVYWYVSQGDSVVVDDNGLVTPRTETWYWYGNYGTTYPMEGQEPTEVEVSYITGESTVTCIAGEEILSTVINVIDYSDVYVDKKIQSYIDANITESMTDYEKLEKVCEYTANFEYSVYYSSYKSMVIYEGGDCWASATLITRMCNDYLDIDAAVRYGVNDPGAGSGHRNAVVCIDGKFYEAEAGFASPVPRPYCISELPEGFSFKSNADGYVMYQYDGMENEVVIPETYKDLPVTEISGGVFYYNRWNGFAPVSVTIPASVKTISTFAFSDIKSIQNFFVDGDNEFFASADGVIYSKDRTTLFAYPSGKEAGFAVPEGTVSIGDYSFYYANNLTKAVLPDGVTHVGEGAFADCCVLSTVVLPETLQTIDNFAFYNDSKLTEIYIPGSVTEIGENVFSNSDSLTIYGEEGSYAQEYALSKGISFISKEDGDVNLDGKIDIKDATAIQKYLADIISFTTVQKEVADFNHDGKVTVADATAIQKFLAGLEY